MTELPKDKGYKYVPEDRAARASRIADEIDRRVGIRGKRVLDVGCHRAELSEVLVSKYDCQVVGVDIESHDNWASLQSHPNLTLLTADIAQPCPELARESFDRIVSISVWEHIWHPWSALKQCQEYLKPDGKFYLFAMLYRSAGASHLIHRIPERWPHLIFRPEEIMKKINASKLGPSFWCNKLTYQQYLFYFRQLGFFVTFESFNRDMFDEKTYREYEHLLSLYPTWDLQTDFFKVVLEFDPNSPKARIEDPVYRLMPSGG